ncbi:MAG: glycosyltransferase [Actinomycetes bacterium]
MKLTVLMTVYDGAEPDQLRRALESVVRQTRVPDEILVVEDGPLRPALREVLARFQDDRRDVVRLLPLPENVGGGAASDVGLRAATWDVVAKMDADDVAMPTRFETQLRLLEEQGLDVVGSSMLEFEGAESNVVGLRRPPLSHQEIARYARLHNPLNHPTVMMRRDAALRAGGYVEIKYVEDYDLWARMLASGARFGNVAEPLLLFRTSSAMYRRRAGVALLRSEWVLQRRLQELGLVSGWQRARNLVLRCTFRLLPTGLLRLAYARLLRARRASDAAAGLR